MVAIVIVTRNQYLLASKIHHISMTEHRDFVEVRTNVGRYRTIQQDSYILNIYYSPDINNLGSEYRQCEVTIRGKVDAYRVYADLIRQIREQSPDQLFLDKALEDLLGQHTSEINDLSVNYDEEWKFDTDTTTVRKPRKAKRRSKKVLRKPKARRRSRKS